MSDVNSKKIPVLSEFVVNNKPTQFCWDYITTLAKVVIAKYFAKYLEHFDRDDLLQLAITDAVSFTIRISKTQTDSMIKNMRNVLFTRIRNCISNFIFKSNKLVNTDDEILNNVVVSPKSCDVRSDLIDLHDLAIDSLDSFRSVSLSTWKLFKSNAVQQQHYTINENTDDLEDWKTYSEVKNMKSPCDLISLYNKYNEDEVETLAIKLDDLFGQNYFSTLYQLLGDKFLAFLDVFQEDTFKVPATNTVKTILLDLSICNDYASGTPVDKLALKYKKPDYVIERIIESRDII